MKNNQTINFAIVGCGAISSKHVQAIKDCEKAKLIAVCDAVKEKADRLAAKENCRAYYAFTDLLKDDAVDVVSICAPNGLHASMSIMAMKAGKHVLCEKPMTLSLSEAEDVVKANKETGKKFFLVKQNRFNPPIIALKEAFKKNQLGKVFLINATVYWNRNDAYYSDSDWRGTKEMDGGALFTQSSHFLDLMLWLGGEASSVYSVMNNVSHPNIETEDLGVLIIRFKNGAVGTLQYTMSVYEKNFEGTIGVLGTKGTVKIGGKYLNELEFWNVAGVPTPQLEQSRPPNDYGTYQGTMSNHDKVYKNVVAVLTGNGDIATPAAQGKDSIEVMQAAVISSIKRKEILLPLKGEDREFQISKASLR